MDLREGSFYPQRHTSLRHAPSPTRRYRELTSGAGSPCYDWPMLRFSPLPVRRLRNDPEWRYELNSKDSARLIREPLTSHGHAANAVYRPRQARSVGSRTTSRSASSRDSATATIRAAASRSRRRMKHGGATCGTRTTPRRRRGFRDEHCKVLYFWLILRALFVAGVVAMDEVTTLTLCMTELGRRPAAASSPETASGPVRLILAVRLRPIAAGRARAHGGAHGP
jgi:hypothetical protein